MLVAEDPIVGLGLVGAQRGDLLRQLFAGLRQGDLESGYEQGIITPPIAVILVDAELLGAARQHLGRGRGRKGMSGDAASRAHADRNFDRNNEL